MKQTLLILLACGPLWAAAQSVDSVKTPSPKASSLSKYEQPSQYGVPPAPASGQPRSVQPNLVKKIDDKRVNSSYQYENGRIVGGKTSLKLGKKKE